jgi:hypothetical protein
VAFTVHVERRLNAGSHHAGLRRKRAVTAGSALPLNYGGCARRADIANSSLIILIRPTGLE